MIACLPVGTADRLGASRHALGKRRKGLIGQSVVFLDDVDAAQRQLVRQFGQSGSGEAHGLDRGAQQGPVGHAEQPSDARTSKARAFELPQDPVSQFQLGMLQTVYDSRRTFYYQPAPYKPGVLQQIGTAIAPGLFGDRVKVTDLCKPLPVRDGDNGVVPWYGNETVADFDNAPDSTKSTQIYDRPGTAMEWTKTVNGKEQQLVKTGGQDSFRTWISVQEKGTSGFMGMHRLAYIDWKVDYGTDVKYNSADPASSVVTPTGESGGKITQISDGFGAFIPLMSDPVANDAATNAGSEDHAKDDVRTLRRAVGGFRGGEAVGVVGDADGALERALDVADEGLAVEPDRVRGKAGCLGHGRLPLGTRH